MMLRTILAALALLPIFGEDRPVTPEKQRQLDAISQAVRAAAKTPDEAAFLLAFGWHESNFSLRIAQGRCKPHECDRGKARSPWQLHRVGMTEERWAQMQGVEHVNEQAAEAMNRARWALRQCSTDRIRGAFRVLSGRGCQYPLKGEAERVATFERVRRRL